MMKTHVCNFLLFIFAITSNDSFSGKNVNHYVSYNSMSNSALQAKVYIAYPREKEDKKFFVYFNAKGAGVMTYGSRIMCNLSTEGMLKITISNEGVYREPATLARNTRSISTKKGKEYYFEINGKGELDYIINTDKGKSRFLDNGSYAGAPKVIDESTTDGFMKP